MSLARKGKSLSKEIKEKISKANKGKTLKEETKAKISKALSGINNPLGMLGKSHTENSLAKMRESQKA
jgi:hypothetical protein